MFLSLSCLDGEISEVSVTHLNEIVKSLSFRPRLSGSGFDEHASKEVPTAYLAL